MAVWQFLLLGALSFVAMVGVVIGLEWVGARLRGRITRRVAVLLMVLIFLASVAWQTWAPEWMGAPWLLAMLAAFWVGANRNRKPEPPPGG